MKMMLPVLMSSGGSVKTKIKSSKPPHRPAVGGNRRDDKHQKCGEKELQHQGLPGAASWQRYAQLDLRVENEVQRYACQQGSCQLGYDVEWHLAWGRRMSTSQTRKRWSVLLALTTVGVDSNRFLFWSALCLVLLVFSLLH